MGKLRFREEKRVAWVLPKAVAELGSCPHPQKHPPNGVQLPQSSELPTHWNAPVSVARSGVPAPHLTEGNIEARGGFS